MVTKRKKPRMSSSAYGAGSAPVCSPAFWSFVMLVVMALLVVFCVQQFITNTSSSSSTTSSTTLELRSLPFSQYPTLRYALENADMVGLYFAASWCPMSTPVTEKLGHVFTKDVLLPPPTTTSLSSATSDGNGGKRFPFALVFVTSDQSDTDMMEYAKPHWINIPYNSEENVALKKHFSVCARVELPVLDMERKQEIPSLLVLDGPTHGLLTTHGAQDLLEEEDKQHNQQQQQQQQQVHDNNNNVPQGAYQHWKELQAVVRGLQDKYS